MNDSKQHIAALIQARMRSTRLPGKVMAEVVDRPVIWHVVRRAKDIESVNDVIVVTSKKPDDDIIEKFCMEHRIKCFRGSEEDVLDRYYQAAKHFGIKTIVRITADCPMLDPVIVNQAIKEYLVGGYDYVSTAYPEASYPDGLDTEVFSFQTLESAWRDARLPSEREHVTPFIWKNEKGRFRIGNINHSPNLSDKRWTLDDETDLQFIREIYTKLYKEDSIFYMGDVLKLLEKHPELESINSGTKRNEGYLKSLEEDIIKMSDGEETSLNVSESLRLFEQAKKIIPSCTQTFSKGWTQYPFGVSPIFVSRADKGHVWDVDGNEYIDWPMALGPIILGHNYPTVIEAVKEQLNNGVAFSLPHMKELNLAEKLCQWFPYAEMVRFGKNGSDATAGAIRAARAYTGKDVILCCGYHGWQDWYIGTTTRSAGVPKTVRDLTVPFPYNDINTLERFLKQYKGKVAAVIMEPVGVIFPDKEYLYKVRELVHAHAALLIFDECWTGFRLHKQGAYGYFGVSPDMACFGKAMGNGFPISAIVGRADIMTIFDEIFFSFTFGGDVVGLTAALDVLKTIEERPVLETIEKRGKILIDGIIQLITEYELQSHIGLQGYPARNIMTFVNDGYDGLLLKSVVQQEAIKQGILCGGYHVVTYSHTEKDINDTISAYKKIFAILKGAIDSKNLRSLLKGKMVKPVFRKF
ncbi:MAG: aminotransferase class III-fold pyridoxal phosphate-dependent enzyme [Thermodesulfobacteriota bacterium]